MSTTEASPVNDFIRTAVKEDLAAGRFAQVVTRFPPEPNGYLHIGHAKAICIDFGIAADFGGRCHLRFDDSNPAKENWEFVEAIQDDIRWLGFEWGEHRYFASDYFEQLYDWAVQLIEAGKAYVCDLTQEEFAREYRGTIKEPGKGSPYRERSVAENLDLFARMRAGEFPDGARCLRARIDMASPNMLLRDPVMYRIVRQHHYRLGDGWCIYPTYDYIHGQSDSIEGVTFSLCDLGFEIHRPLYDWFCDALGIHHPRQIEFARLNLTYTVLSKRWLTQLVERGLVSGWDDPRMPTLRGLRRRGYTPEAIRTFCRRIGVAKAASVNEIEQLESCLREDLNKRAPRFMAVLNPLKIVLENYPEGQEETFEAVNNPEDSDAGTRPVPFSREVYIERDDFMEDPPKKFFRLAPGREVRLRYAYLVTCREVVKDANGNVVELRCTYDPATQGGNTPDGRKVKSTLHWVSAAHAVTAQTRLYEHLFTTEDPMDVPENADFTANLNPESLKLLEGCQVEPALAHVDAGTPVQFERLGYFCADPDGTPEHPVFNRTVGLRDAWARLQKQ